MQSFGVVFSPGSLMIRDWFCLGSEYFYTIMFVFSSSSVNIGFGFGFCIDGTGNMFLRWSSVTD